MTMVPLMEAEAYEGVFARWRGARARYFGAIGNVGDRLIDLATMQLFEHFGIQVVESGESDVWFWAGGGNMGDLYPRTIGIRKQAAERAVSAGVPFVVLPQSWNAADDTRWSEAFARERESLRFAPDAILAPDLALAFRVRDPLPAATMEVGLFFREDLERHPDRSRGMTDPAKVCRSPHAYLALAARYEEIHTDRLHFAISGLIAGRRVVLYENSYHKNRAVWREWLQGLGCGFEEGIEHRTSNVQH